MTIEKMISRQQKELAEYYQYREIRLNDLLAGQNELIHSCIVVSPKTHELLKNLLQEQRQIWEAMEQEELDMLKHIHTLEREGLFDKKAKQSELAAILSGDKEKNQDRGR